MQRRVSLIAAVELFIEFLPAALSTLVLVTAADRLGRKPLLTIPILGYLAYNLTFLVNWSVSQPCRADRNPLCFAGTRRGRPGG